MSAFTIDETDREGTVELVLAGDLDMSATFVLEPVLDRVLAAGPRALVLQLGDVAFVDSSGLGLLIATHERTGRAGVEMAITEAGPEVQRLLYVTGLNDVLPVRD